MRISNRYPLAKAVLLAVVALLLSLTPAYAAPDSQRPDLHMISVGITYDPQLGAQNQTPLPCCKKDAVDMARWADSQKGKLFGDVRTQRMIDGQAKAADILGALRALNGTTKTGDYIIVYLSGHGGAGGYGEYVFCAHDRNVAWRDIRDALRDIPGTIIVVLDACHSGAVKDNGNIIVLAAALASQPSTGYINPQKNSLYTRLLLEALNGQADMNRDGLISLAEVDAYVSGKLALDNNGPQSTTLRPANVPSALPLAKLGQAAPVTPIQIPAVPAPFAAAPIPAVQPGAQNLAGTTWIGSENLGGFGKLTFQFAVGGKAVMIDATSTVAGTYTVDGNQIVIRLPGLAPYRGTINGTTIAGQATSNVATWSFTVTMQK